MQGNGLERGPRDPASSLGQENWLGLGSHGSNYRAADQASTADPGIRQGPRVKGTAKQDRTSGSWIRLGL